MNLNSIKRQIEANNKALLDILLVQTLKKLHDSFLKIIKNHTKIEYAQFGNGTWSFEGLFTVKFFDGVEWVTTETGINIYCDFDRPHKKIKACFMEFSCNQENIKGAIDWTGLTDGIIEFYEAAETVLEFCFTTDFDIIAEIGIVFLVDRDDVSRKREETQNSKLCKMLIENEIPFSMVQYLDYTDEVLAKNKIIQAKNERYFKVRDLVKNLRIEFPELSDSQQFEILAIAQLNFNIPVNGLKYSMSLRGKSLKDEILDNHQKGKIDFDRKTAKFSLRYDNEIVNGVGHFFSLIEV